MEGDDPLVTQCRGRVGRLISGKWRLDALIGVGGMAAVYMATHRNGSMAAVKILHEEVALNQEVRERFLREAYIANKVNHPGTVKVLDDDKDEHGAPYIVMELLRGESIESRAQRAGGRLAITDTLDILDQTLAVLESAHAQTIVHRDLKPENLFMTEQAQVKVLDFGIARLREDNAARRTQTGLVMGTPAFMAPEQAMGRWSDVDARTDLWAMGATGFTLLTGLPVHEAETAGEMLVAAATRPARSLARVLNGAPFPLVAMLDRALAYERDNRFPDATSFRQELAKVRASLKGEVSLEQPQSPQKPLVPATVVGNEAPLPLLQTNQEADESRERIETFDPSSNSDEEIARMVKVFALLERALTSTKQYSKDHPEPKRRVDEAFRELAAALMTCDIALAWNLTPYSFTARDEVLWEPEAPWNRVPYQLFSDGVRTMGFAPGLDQTEFQSWLSLIILDPTSDFAPEDDLVTLLWDANLDHVFFQAIDSFAEGNQDQRARYEAERANVIAGAHVDHTQELTEAWATERRPGKRSAAERNNAAAKSRELMQLIARGDGNDAEAQARVANLNLMEDSEATSEAVGALQVDETTRALLAARMEIDVAAISERFVVAAAEAFVVSAKNGRSAAVTAPLRRAVDSLASSAPHKAVDMILELREAVMVENKEAETESLRETMTSEVLSPTTLLAILRGSAKLDDDARVEYLKGVARVLICLQPQHFDPALTFLGESAAGELQQLLFTCITRNSRGNEAKIATLFATAPVDLGLSLVRLLAELDTPAAKEAVAMGSQSPHALVRIEALGHIEGVAGTRLRLELKKLLEDPDPAVRLLALRAMESHNITIAGPFLVLRIQDPEFIKLSLEERTQALRALGRLRPKRCEEVCIALLADARLLRTGGREETRELAAQVLGEVAASDPALFLLESIAKSSGFRNSRRVRDAASAALERLKQRASEAEKRRAERKHPSQHETKKRRSGSTIAPEAGTPAAKGGGNASQKTGGASPSNPNPKTGGSSSSNQKTGAGSPSNPNQKTGASSTSNQKTGSSGNNQKTGGAAQTNPTRKTGAAGPAGVTPDADAGAPVTSALAGAPAANTNDKTTASTKNAAGARATAGKAAAERTEGEPRPNKEARSQT
jgi:serine/threonine protein kinase